MLRVKNQMIIDKIAVIDLLIEHCLVGIAVIAEDGKFEAANPAFCELTEYTESELQQKTFQSISHPDDLHDDIEMCKRIVSMETHVHNMKKRYITKTGRVIWIVLRVVGYHDEEGRFHYFLAQASPILELAPPRLPSQYKGNGLPPIRFQLWNWFKKNKAEILLIGAGVVVGIGEIIKYVKAG